MTNPFRKKEDKNPFRKKPEDEDWDLTARRETSPGQGEAFLRGAGQGASFGLADEMQGQGARMQTMWDAATEKERLDAMQKAAKAGDWDAYRQMQKGVFAEGNKAAEARTSEYRTRDVQAREAYPKTFMGGQVAGAIPLAATGYGAINPAYSMPMRMGAGAALGATEGGFQAFNEGEGNFWDRLENVPSGMKWGAAFGAGSEPLSSLAGYGLRKAANFLGNPIKGYVPSEIDHLSRILRRDRTNLADAADTMRSPGPGAQPLPIDIGRNMRQTGKAIASAPGEGGSILEDAILARQKTAKGRMREVVDETFGPRQNQYLATQQAKKARAAAAKKGYQPAFDEGWGRAGVPEDKMTSILMRLQPEDLKDAKMIGAYLESDVGDIVSFKDGEKVINRMPTLEEAEYIYRALRDRTKAAWQGKDGLRPGMAQGMQSTLDDLDGVLTTSSKRLKAARQKYADDSLIIEAREAGRKLLNPSTDFDELEVTFPRMPDEAKGAYRSGSRSQVADKMDSASWNAQDSAKSLRNDRNMDKLALVLEDQEKADMIYNALEGQRSEQLANNTVMQGSDTAAKLMSAAELGITPAKGDPGVLKSIGNFAYGDAVEAVVDNVRSLQRVATKEQFRNRLAKLLSDPDALINAAQYGPRIDKLNAIDEATARIARGLLRASQRPAISYTTGGGF